MFEKLKEFWTNPSWIILICFILLFSGARYLDKNDYIFTSSTIEENISVFDPNITFSNVFTIRKENVTNFSEDEEYYYIRTNIVWER